MLRPENQRWSLINTTDPGFPEGTLDHFSISTPSHPPEIITVYCSVGNDTTKPLVFAVDNATFDLRASDPHSASDHGERLTPNPRCHPTTAELKAEAPNHSTVVSRSHTIDSISTTRCSSTIELGTMAFWNLFLPSKAFHCLLIQVQTWLQQGCTRNYTACPSGGMMQASCVFHQIVTGAGQEL